MEEWVAGADEVLAKFGDMIDMVCRFLACAAELLFGFSIPLTDQGPYEVRCHVLLYHHLR